MTGCIQLGHHKAIGHGIIVCVIKGLPIQVFMEFFDYHPFEGEKFQLVCGVKGFSLGEAPTSIGYYCVCAIFVGLVENSSKSRPTSISVKLEMLGEICLSKKRYSGTQSLQVIEGLLAPVLPLNGSLFLATVFTQS